MNLWQLDGVNKSSYLRILFVKSTNRRLAEKHRLYSRTKSLLQISFTCVYMMSEGSGTGLVTDQTGHGFNYIKHFIRARELCHHGNDNKHACGRI